MEEVFNDDWYEDDDDDVYGDINEDYYNFNDARYQHNLEANLYSGDTYSEIY